MPERAFELSGARLLGHLADGLLGKGKLARLVNPGLAVDARAAICER